MSNLSSAKTAIADELSAAKKGLAFYTSRITTLEKLLSQLDTFDGKPAVEPIAAHNSQAKVAKIAKVMKTKGTTAPTAKLPKQSSSENELPFTGGDYWLNLVTTEPQSARDILNVAVKALGFPATKEQVGKLANRETFALNAMVKAKQIKDSGSGRERRFFKK